MKVISFSVDLILSLIIFSIVLILIYKSLFIEIPTIKISEINPQSIELGTKNHANEILLSFLTTRVSELNLSFLINEEDLNKNFAEFITSMYLYGVYTNNDTLKNIAANITEDFLKNIAKNYCIEVNVKNYTIYKNCKNYSSNVQSASIFISGLEYGKPISGYIARAWLTKYKKVTKEVIDFIVSGSGWKVIGGNGGDFEYYKTFYISEDNEILDGTLYVSMHVGNIRTEVALFKTFYLNDCNIRNDVLNNIVYSQCEGSGTEVTCAIFSIINVTSCLKKGLNSVRIVAGSPQTYHAHFHPGFRLSLTLKKPESLKEGVKEFRQRIYFDRIIGRTGVWMIYPFFVPENAIFYNASLFLRILNVEDTRLGNINTSDIIIFLNSENPIYRDGNDVIGINYPYNPYYCSSIDWRNYYCSRTIVSTRNINLTLNLTPYLLRGTNTLSIYINSFGDFHWGSEFAEISNESYIEIYYVLNETNLKYGEIDITKEILFGGRAENPKRFFYNRTEEKISSSFIHLVQGFSAMINASINNISFYTSPSPRAVPSHFYLNPALIRFGNNSIEIRDFQPGGSISPTNYILPWTSIEINYIVKGLVGYGNVFEREEDAINDAINRLKAQIGNIDIEDIYIDKQDVFGVKWFWGPEVFRISIWSKQ